ncbi:MAG: hypothetical protein RIR18_1684 [Pseudomonadota bacterium]|jgi:hypothetical protein
MKVLAIGAMWVPYIRENWFDALKKILGDEVDCINTAPLFYFRDKCSWQPDGYHCAYIYDIIRHQHYDYVFFYPDWIAGNFHGPFFDKIRRAGVKILSFLPDDEPETWYAANREFDHHYDLIASHSKAGAARRVIDLPQRESLYLPWGYNPRTCYQLPNTEKKIDICFIGKRKVTPEKGIIKVEDGAQREITLERIGTACLENSWNFRIFGHGWDSHPTLSQFYGGYPSQTELVEIYNQCKIVFNPAWSSDGQFGQPQTKLRHFEVAGCGAFQLTNSNPELAELFLVDEEIVFFDDDDDLVRKVRHYLTDHASRERIAQAGYAKALSSHTLDNRVTTLFDHARKVFSYANHTPQIAPSSPIITTTLGHYQQQYQDKLLPANTWFHFVPDTLDTPELGYSLVQPFLAQNPDQLVAIRTYVYTHAHAQNAMQPKLTEIDHVVLSNTTSVAEIEAYPNTALRQNFEHIESNGVLNFMCNAIVPSALVDLYVQAFVTKDHTKWAALPQAVCGRIALEIRLDPAQATDLDAIRPHPYVQKLRKLIPALRSTQRRVALYGVSGMGEVVLKLFAEHADYTLAAVIDRSAQSGAFSSDIPIIRPDEINDKLIDVVIIGAGASGDQIYKSISHLESKIIVIPLYNLNHPIWHVLDI